MIVFDSSKQENGKPLESVNLLEEIERSTPDAIARERAHTRVSLRSAVIVQPGNHSQRRTLKVQAVTGDVSAGGCLVLSPIPLLVGDTYLLSFTRHEIDLAPILARCLRCRLVREDAFEVGFGFFQPIDLQSAISSTTPTDAR